MKKAVLLSLTAAVMLQAADATLDPITIDETKISDVDTEKIKSGDVAEALAEAVPGITLIRRSGIANDIILRGQKRDNINVLVDATKTCGACPNRMDPPTSHIMTTVINDITVLEGPYDVENFGTLSGEVAVTTKDPTKAFGGDINLNYGSWQHEQAGATVTGGTDKVQFLITGTFEQSHQYKDGDGNTLAQQLYNDSIGKTSAVYRYQSRYSDMKAYEKKAMMAKANVNITDDQQLKLSYILNRSDNVLYANTGMDAIYDNSDIYNAEYLLKNLSAYSKALSLQAYYSTVDHPMSTQYRDIGASTYKTNHLKTHMKGAKIKNTIPLGTADLTLGLDASERQWNGSYSATNVATGMTTYLYPSINHAKTKNSALFGEAVQTLGKAEVKVGARYDHTTVQSNVANTPTNTYNALGAYLFTSYATSATTRVFGGFGTSTRVPDGRELYFVKSTPVGALTIGNPNLKQTRNYEADLGVEQQNGIGTYKAKVFYSKLKNYIYYAQIGAGTFQNIDAHIYGAEFTGKYYPTDTFLLEAGAACQRGIKDTQPTGQTNTNLADIPPLRGNVATNYYYTGDNYVRAEMQASARWDNIDSENGEQVLPAYAVFNLKAVHTFIRTMELTVGVNNVANTTYAVSNTYKDLSLVSPTGDDVMLLNEPGRYFYANLNYKF